MRNLKNHPLLKMVNSYIIDSSQPTNLSYLWNFGSLLAFSLGIQMLTGVTLAMHYNPSTFEAFNSVEHIMRDVNNGWLLRYIHANAASAFFFTIYLHIGRGLYYGSYKAPRTLVWTIGTIILILIMAIAFLGYVLPYGQMSLWGATVITSLMSAIPWIGQDIVEFIWGGFSVNNATLNRFFALHFVLPFVLAALALAHLISLHDRAGSGNPIGTSGNYDRLPFAPYYIFKDLITIFLYILILSVFVFFIPNVLGDSENYVMANPMQTPPAIVPEWYLLPFYAVLRSIPNKFLGVIAMFSAIIILLAMPFTDLSKLRGTQFRPLTKTIFFIFIGNFLILMILGAKHVEFPFIEFGQITTVLYFIYFLFVVPLGSIFDTCLAQVTVYYNVIISRLVKVTEDRTISRPDKVTENTPAKAFPELDLPLQSGISFNFARDLFLIIKRKYTIRHIVSLCIGLIVAWCIRSLVISQIGNLNIFLDFFSVAAVAHFFTNKIIDFVELLPTYLAFDGSPGADKAVVVSGTGPSRGSMPVLGATTRIDSPADEVSSNVENLYVSTGRGEYMDKKVELYKHEPLINPGLEKDNVGPLQQALYKSNIQEIEPSKGLEDSLNAINTSKEVIAISEKVLEYIQAKDAGLEPSPEARMAFEKRQAMFLDTPQDGPFIDYNDLSNVRNRTESYLEQTKVLLDIEDSVYKAISKETFTGPDANANYAERRTHLWDDNCKRHADYLEFKRRERIEIIDTYDKKTIDTLLEKNINHRKKLYNDSLNKWLEKDPANLGLYNEWSKDKINKDFIQKWFSDGSKG